MSISMRELFSRQGIPAKLSVCVIPWQITLMDSSWACMKRMSDYSRLPIWSRESTDKHILFEE